MILFLLDSDAQFSEELAVMHWASSVTSKDTKPHKPISQATLDNWHFDRLLSGLSMYHVTSITVRKKRVVEIAGDYEDCRIRLMYRRANSNVLREIHLMDSPATTGMVIQSREQMAEVKAALRPLVRRFIETLTDAIE